MYLPPVQHQGAISRKMELDDPPFFSLGEMMGSDNFTACFYFHVGLQLHLEMGKFSLETKRGRREERGGKWGKTQDVGSKASL